MLRAKKPPKKQPIHGELAAVNREHVVSKKQISAWGRVFTKRHRKYAGRALCRVSTDINNIEHVEVFGDSRAHGPE